MANILLPEEYAALEASPHRPMHVLQVGWMGVKRLGALWRRDGGNGSEL